MVCGKRGGGWKQAVCGRGRKRVGRPTNTYVTVRVLAKTNMGKRRPYSGEEKLQRQKSEACSTSSGQGGHNSVGRKVGDACLLTPQREQRRESRGWALTAGAHHFHEAPLRAPATTPTGTGGMVCILQPVVGDQGQPRHLPPALHMVPLHTSHCTPHGGCTVLSPSLLAPGPSGGGQVHIPSLTSPTTPG